VPTSTGQPLREKHCSPGKGRVDRLDRLRAVLPACVRQGTTLISNMGAAHPEAAGAAVLAVARELGQGVLVGHLLECAAQVSGGYIADPGHVDVPDLHNVGFPLAEVQADGSAVITKLAVTGGRVDRLGCTAQLLYEIKDPARYLQPDVVADFSRVQMHQQGPDRVRVHGAGGTPRSAQLKATLGYRDGFIGEGQIGYAGPGAVARGQLALQVLQGRGRWRDAVGARGHRRGLGDGAARGRAQRGAGAGDRAVKLQHIAIARSGDKGNCATLGVIARDLAHYPLLERVLTAERVQAHYRGIVLGAVVRHTLPHLGALHFVMDNALGGGVTRSLALDAHGKTLSAAILDIEIGEPD